MDQKCFLHFFPVTLQITGLSIAEIIWISIGYENEVQIWTSEKSSANRFPVTAHMCWHTVLGSSGGLYEIHIGHEEEIGYLRQSILIN